MGSKLRHTHAHRHSHTHAKVQLNGVIAITTWKYLEKQGKSTVLDIHPKIEKRQTNIHKTDFHSYTFKNRQTYREHTSTHTFKHIPKHRYQEKKRG